MKQKKKIIITGGHHTAALVVAQKLKTRGHQVVWLGHKYTMWGDKNYSAEYREVAQAKIRFRELRAGKISQKQRFRNCLRISVGFWQARDYLRQEKPDLILSFGGYLAVPVVICGWLRKIPVFTHEQTVVYGWANRLISHFSKKIMVSWLSSVRHFPAQKVVFTGLPLRPEIFKATKLAWFKNKRLTIYITGGKQGSHVINLAVEGALLDLLKKYNLIHQCGSSTVHNDYRRLQTIRKQLPAKLRSRYVVRDYIFPKDIGSVFHQADLIVGRSGAHISAEVAALSKPALFIPIPWSRANEQYQNARMIVNTGLAEILPQDDLSALNLEKKIEKMILSLNKYQRNALRAQTLIRLDATEKIVSLIEAQ